MRTATLLLAVVVVLVAAPAWAEPDDKEKYTEKSEGYSDEVQAYRDDLKAFLGAKEWAEYERAQDLSDATYANDQGDYATALKKFRPHAEQGDVYAQYSLGWMYAEGLGVPQDHTEAARWYRLAAEQGDVVAQYTLGVMYANGEGVPQDYKEAVRWYSRAASY